MEKRKFCSIHCFCAAATSSLSSSPVASGVLGRSGWKVNLTRPLFFDEPSQAGTVMVVGSASVNVISLLILLSKSARRSEPPDREVLRFTASLNQFCSGLPALWMPISHSNAPSVGASIVFLVKWPVASAISTTLALYMPGVQLLRMPQLPA